MLRTFPEVERVFGTVGRGTTPTDNTPMGMVNTTVMLKPREQWRPGMTLEKLQAEMDDAAAVPGLPERRGRSRSATGSTCCSPASRRRSASRSSAPISNVIQRLGQRDRARARKPCPARAACTRSAWRRATSPTSASIATPSRGTACTIEDVQDVDRRRRSAARTSRGRSKGRERYPVNVRYEREFRDDLPRSAARAGARRRRARRCRSAQLAHDHAHARAGDDSRRGRPARRLRLRRHDDARHRRLRRRGAGARSPRRVTLPPGYTLQWTGQYEFQVRARERLQDPAARSSSSSSSCCST